MKRIFLCIPLIAFIFLITFYLPSSAVEKRGISVRSKLAQDAGLPLGTYRALVIGINQYKDPNIPDLKTAVKDAKVMAELLREEYGFSDVKLLLDKQGSHEGIIKALRGLIMKSKETDSVLIYYAGHGDLDRITGSGWWIPHDASGGTSSTYISNPIIQLYIKKIPARHVLLVSDSCFSGTLFGETRAIHPVINDKYYATLFQDKSRWGMTSGNFTPVADSGSGGHSIFAERLISTLKKNQKPFITPSEIYVKIAPVIRNNSEQMPKCKPIKDVGDRGGEFVFIRTAAIVPTAPPKPGILITKEKNLVMVMRWDPDFPGKAAKEIIDRIQGLTRNYDFISEPCALLEECLTSAKGRGYGRLALVTFDKKVRQTNVGAYKGTLNVRIGVYNTMTRSQVHEPVNTFGQVISWDKGGLDWSVAAQKIMKSDVLGTTNRQLLLERP